jgi:hypothetical protein
MARGFVLGLGIGAALGFAGARLLPWSAPDPREEPNGNANRHVPSRPEPTGLAPDPEGGLRQRFAETQTSLDRVARELEAVRQAPPPAPAERPDEKEMPLAARKEAARLGVSDAAMDRFWRVRNRYYGADSAMREELVAPLRPFGEEAVRAAAALQLGGGGHIDVPMIVGDLRLREGGEVVVRIMEEHKGLSALARSLPAYDSPAVRTYLLDRIAQETDAAAYWNLSAALGDLKETRGPKVMRVQHFIRPGWTGVRGSILYDVGRMGGPAGVRLLEEYIQIATADQLGVALRALETLDRDRAIGHARRIRDGDRYAFLDMMDRTEVDALTR